MDISRRLLAISGDTVYGLPSTVYEFLWGPRCGSFDSFACDDDLSVYLSAACVIIWSEQGTTWCTHV